MWVMADVFDLSGMYEKYDRALLDMNLIDLKDVRGTGLYVDSEGERAIREAIRDRCSSPVHLIDTGDYHYVTRLFLYDIREDFDLLVYDHHDDNKPPEFQGLRSCGSWIKDALEDMGDILCSVKLIKGKDDISFLKGSFDVRRPLYISIDKDVLDKEICPTNWDQGDMTMEEIVGSLKEEIKERRILGVDICGGPSGGPGAKDSDVAKNQMTDMAIIASL